jgi:dipeptidase D
MDTSSIFRYFDEICQIPRESGNEGQIIEYLCEFARKNSFEYKKDEAGNVLIKREASPGYENMPAIVLQSHSDMVCEKNSTSNHDFTKDPIKYVIEDGWMIAKETTLGADCGIGMAAQMAVLTDKKIESQAIEALFTTEEETGLTGAKSLKPGFITGKYLINLDSEDEGEIFIGCAGGIDTTARFKYTREKAESNLAYFKISIFGATGGHSGDDINKNRANAVQLLARILCSLLKETGMKLSEIDGGNKRNAIAREAYAVIALKSSAVPKAEKLFAKFREEIKSEYNISDPQLDATFSQNGSADTCISDEVTEKLILSLYGVPHGVLAMSQDIKDFVETSTNLASVKMPEQGIITVATSQRSSLSGAKYNAAGRIESVFTLAGAEVTHESEYPGWQPNPRSHLLKVSRESYKRLFGTEPVVRAIHAGLECGMFADIYPGIDMVSFGPTLRGVHAPGEKLEIASVEKFAALLEEIIKNLK